MMRFEPTINSFSVFDVNQSSPDDPRSRLSAFRNWIVRSTSDKFCQFISIFYIAFVPNFEILKFLTPTQYKAIVLTNHN